MKPIPTSSRRGALAAAGALALGLALPAHAQGSYPNRPIRMIVPLAAGSAVDVAARLLAQKMSASMGQSIVVENLVGAAGIIGAAQLTRAAPDGYTIGGFNDSIMTMLPNLHAKMPWDINKEFDPVSLVATMEWAMVAPATSPFRTAADVIAAAKARPGALNYSSGGNGSPQHVAMELFKARAGIFMTHIPYRGATAAAMDAASGQVDVHLSGLTTVQPMVRSGQLKVLGVAGPRHSALLPDTPTVSESGLAGFEFTSWFGVVTPVGTPKDIVARLNAEIVKAASAPEVREKLVAQGFAVRASSPEDLSRATRDQLERYGKLFKQAGIRID